MGKDFNESVNVLFDKVEDLVSTKTVVGEAMTIGDMTLLPLIEVSVGAAAGAKENVNAAGGVGAKISPSSIMVIHNGNIQVVHLQNVDAVSRLIEMAPSVVEKVNFGSIFKNRNKATDGTMEAPAPAPDIQIDVNEKIVTEKFTDGK